MKGITINRRTDQTQCQQGNTIPDLKITERQVAIAISHYDNANHHHSRRLFLIHEFKNENAMASVGV